MASAPAASPQDSVQYLPGVGPSRAALLGRLGIATLEDLIYYFPRRYLDRRSFTPIASLREGVEATIRGTVLLTGLDRTKSGRALFRLIVADGTGQIACTWFNQPYLKNSFKASEEAIFSGKPARYGKLQLANPEFEKMDREEGERLSAGRIVPVYPLTEGLSQKLMRSIVRAVLSRFPEGLPDFLPEETRVRWKVAPLSAALADIHYPPDPAALQAARQRLVLDEFFLLQLALALRRRLLTGGPPAPPHSRRTPLFDAFLRALPFALTGAQKRVLEEVRRDMTGRYPMNRLLQGDVGSGKTVIAAGALLITRDGGHQGAIMAPTEILARQHHRTLTELLRPLSLSVDLITGGTTGEERSKVLERIRTGESGFIVGTQALIQSGVEFKSLGTVVADEQHKFGVRERAELRAKGMNPHLLVMSATPIPRTLVLTMYGDLDVSVLDEMPPGRKKVKTAWIGPDRLPQAYAFIRREAGRGRQAYIIYPLIEESESLDAKAAVERFRSLQSRVFPALRLGLLHGRMKAAEKDRIMGEFRSGAIQVLVSTVVVEIGIDVPNATVMLVENAERFGLSQLHQLRGRVGRGGEQSYCILQGNPATESALRRLKAMKTIEDGFLLAQEDLEIRGPGEFFGTRQHGLPEIRIGRIVADPALMEFSRRQAASLLERDPRLSAPDLALLRGKVYERYGKKFALGGAG